MNKPPDTIKPLSNVFELDKPPPRGGGGGGGGGLIQDLRWYEFHSMRKIVYNILSLEYDLVQHCNLCFLASTNNKYD